MELESNIVLQRPLSRCERGPGLILIRPLSYADCQKLNDSLDPAPLQKWAEESFAVVQITLNADSSSDSVKVRDMIKIAKDGLANLEECTVRDMFGFLSVPIFWLSARRCVLTTF